MEAVGRDAAHSLRIRGFELRFDPAAFAAWLVPTILVIYLALANGGYGPVERSEIGIAVWWIVLLGTALGTFRVANGTGLGRAMLGVLTLFALWNALALGWTESAERTATEVGRVAVYLGVFVLALSVQGQGRWRYLLAGLASGMVTVCFLAVLSRLEPTWFPERITEEFLPGGDIERRLAYPLNYSSGLGAFAVIAIPLVLSMTSSAKTLVGQALAAASLPVLALTLWLTASSLSLPAAGIALVVFFVLAPDRIPKLATLVLAGAGSAILMAAVEQRTALDSGAVSPQALAEGDEMKVFLLVVVTAVAIMQVAISLTVRYASRPAWMTPTRRQAAMATALAVVVVASVGVAAGGAEEIGDSFDQFKSRQDTTATSSSRGAQILDISSNGRYQFWQSAIDAYQSEPLTGIGPGTFEYWWSREGLYPGFVRDAHSLYFESLAELGLVGLILIGGFVLGVLAIGTARAIRGPEELRLPMAAAVAGCAAFAVAALVDWVWELAVIPFVFLALAAIVIGADKDSYSTVRSTSDDSPRRLPGGHLTERFAIGILALGAMVAIAIPLARGNAVEESQSNFARGDLSEALTRAGDAQNVQPRSASPYVQRALILEASGDTPQALIAIRTATSNEPTNWRTWFVRSGIEARAGNARQSVAALREARRLNQSGATNVLAPLPTPPPDAP